MKPRHHIRYVDCPLCGQTLYSRSGPKQVRQALQTHAIRVHGLVFEYRLRSELADLAVKHTRYRHPGRTEPLFPWRPAPRPYGKHTEDEKRSGNTPRLLAYAKFLDEAVEGL